ncbi:MAG: hypothetical protein J0M29_22255 [Chitinophagales bacterium]|nr:hypothetical protein [Chitinophagales bacterium]
MKPPIEIQKGFFYPICNEQEIERIFNVKNASDYLLKLRAETIVDHMRLFRVYRNKALKKGSDWSLENSFLSSHYDNVKIQLPEELRIKCDEVTHGNIFSNEPNGLIFKTEYGVVSTISDSLRYFIEFMNLGLLNFGKKVPMKIQLNGIRIALRIMLETEALDFLMDPRGIIPPKIQQKMHSSVPFIMQFIAGHEYAHLLLGHLDDNKTIKKHLLKAIFKSQNDYKMLDVYSTSQQNEFDADVASINLPNYGKKEKMFIFEGALMWYAFLDIYEGVEQSIFPPVGYQSHPTAKERYFNLLNKIETYPGFKYEYWDKHLPKSIEEYRNFFIDEVGFNIEFYEMNGSAYLDEPNTKWRGRELIDRVDYY